MIRIEPAKNRVQWTDDEGTHHVGRELLDDAGCRIHDMQCDAMVAVQLDYDGGLWFVDENVLRPYPDAPIPEPVNQGAGR